mmetsp:Transcript_6807/g.41533  ORF Transcript_6807/g.41533 Transcript_6807/m.41533 type:complete len:103 (+) Transcript_6807:679-987(+)
MVLTEGRLDETVVCSPQDLRAYYNRYKPQAKSLHPLAVRNESASYVSRAGPMAAIQERLHIPDHPHEQRPLSRTAAEGIHQLAYNSSLMWELYSSYTCGCLL